jgi:hypothetical protein
VPVFQVPDTLQGIAGRAPDFPNAKLPHSRGRLSHRFAEDIFCSHRNDPLLIANISSQGGACIIAFNATVCESFVNPFGLKVCGKAATLCDVI